jgi:hypothetical protein
MVGKIDESNALYYTSFGHMLLDLDMSKLKQEDRDSQMFQLPSVQ